MHISHVCANCLAHHRCRRRDFSEQAWTVLTIWGEVAKEAVDQPICDKCYNELREVLIDRADEVERALAQPAKATEKKRQRKLSKLAS